MAVSGKWMAVPAEPEGSRRKALVAFEVPAKLDLTEAEVTDEIKIRQHCAKRQVTLPDAIDIEPRSTPTGWVVVVWENPDTDNG